MKTSKTGTVNIHLFPICFNIIYTYLLIMNIVIVVVIVLFGSCDSLLALAAYSRKCYQFN